MRSRGVYRVWGVRVFLRTKCTVLALAWCLALKSVFMLRSALRIRFPFSNPHSAAEPQSVAVVFSCLEAIMWELWAPISPPLSRPTETVLLMTYFGNQKPLSAQDKMASAEAWLAGASQCQIWETNGAMIFRRMCIKSMLFLYFVTSFVFWFVLFCSDMSMTTSWQGGFLYTPITCNCMLLCKLDAVCVWVCAWTWLTDWNVSQVFLVVPQTLHYSSQFSRPLE